MGGQSSGLTPRANQSTLNAFGYGLGGPITLVSRGGLDIRNSRLDASALGNGGTVALNAGTSIDLTGTSIGSVGAIGGSITTAAPIISISGSRLDVGANIFGGMISLTGTKAVHLSNGTVLNADAGGPGGTIQINGGAQLTSQQSTISAQGGVYVGNSGTIQVNANKVELTDTHLTTSTSGGPQSVGGSITVGAKNMTLTNSQMLSTATEGQGGTINITSPTLHQDASSVIDASSQSGTNGTVTINGVIQP
jgi:hypothetical protein